jgi:hypothetical protein
MCEPADAVMTRRYSSTRYPAHPLVTRIYWTRRTVRASAQCFSSE